MRLIERPPIIAAGGSWSPRQPPKRIREWFFTDGRHLGNCAAVDVPDDVLPQCEGFIVSVPFVSTQ